MNARPFAPTFLLILSFQCLIGGRIDHGHHAGNAYTALHDAVEMANAVAKAQEMTKEGSYIFTAI